jgi:hypothetical protein
VGEAHPTEQFIVVTRIQTRETETMKTDVEIKALPAEEMMVHRNFRGKNFMVQISRWQFQPDSDKYNWNLYCYLYPEHPLFETFKTESYDQEGVGFFDWHGGATLLEFCYGRKKWLEKFSVEDVPHRTAVKIGCDYMHHGDDAFSEWETPSPVLLAHARELFSILNQGG